MWTIARAEVCIAAVQVESVKAWDGILEQLWVILRVEERRRLVIVEAVVLLQVGRVVYRGSDVGKGGIAISPRPMTSEACACHLPPLCSIRSAGVQGRVARVTWRPERTLIYVRRRVWTWALVAVHVWQEVWRGRRVVLCGCHLVHELGWVDRLILLRLRFEQMRIECVSQVRRQRLVLAEGVALEEVEVGIVCVGQVKWVRRDIIAALGAKLRRIVLRNTLCRLEETRIGKGSLLRKGLSLGGGKELRVV